LRIEILISLNLIFSPITKHLRAMDPPSKLFIQMSGAPGSGKSTVSKPLGQSINGVVIDHDLLKSFFLENGIAFDQSGKLAYRFTWVLAEDMIKQGQNVIIDSPCNFKEILDQGTALAQRYNYDYKYVECRVQDMELLDRRLHNRVRQRSQRTGVSCPPADSSGALRSEEEYRALFKRWMEHPYRPVGDIIVVDSTSGPDKCVEFILQRLNLNTSIRTNDHVSTESVLVQRESKDD
jgi:predicted kinase